MGGYRPWNLESTLNIGNTTVNLMREFSRASSIRKSKGFGLWKNHSGD